MRETVVNREALIERLKTNREQHARMLDEGMRLYREAVATKLQDMAVAAAGGVDVPEGHGIDRPRDYTQHYDDAIALLEADTREEITLDEREARKLVLDHWEWQAAFQHTLRGVGYVGEVGEFPHLATIETP